MDTTQLDVCYTTSGSPLTDINDCETAFNDDNEEISCLVNIWIRKSLPLVDYSIVKENTGTNFVVLTIE